MAEKIKSLITFNTPNTISPHIRDKQTINTIMWSVVLALLPSNIFAVYVYGIKAFWIIIVSVLSAVFAEAVFELLVRKPLTISDGSAVITGLLLAMNIPVDSPAWMAASGAIITIIIVKQLFGGLGFNIFNPALAGRVFVMILSVLFLDKWPLYEFSSLITGNIDMLNDLFADSIIESVFIGNSGFTGDVSIFLLLIGALFLFFRRIITWHIPVCFTGTTAVFMLVYYYSQGYSDPVTSVFFHIISGTFVLGAFFMATDTVTTPVTSKGMIVFGIGCGLLTSSIRLLLGFSEGVCFAILLMNAVVPLIDRFTRPKVFGT